MATSDEPVTAEAIPPPSKKKETGPRDPRMVRIGGMIAVAGFIPAIICAAILGSQSANTLPVVEWAHRGALLVILTGFLVIFYGVLRFNQIQASFEKLSRRVPGVTTPPTAHSAWPWIVGFILLLIVASALFTLFAAAGLTLFALGGVMLIPAPMLAVACCGPAKIRPFFAAAMYPAVVLLLMDGALLLLFAGAGFERHRFGPADGGLIALNWGLVLLFPAFGFAGQHFIHWLRSQA